MSDLNKREQQHNFDTFADDIIFPEMQHMLAGDAPYDYSGSDGKLRIYWSESRMLTQGGQGGRPAPFASRLHQISTHFLLNLHVFSRKLPTFGPPDRPGVITLGPSSAA